MTEKKNWIYLSSLYLQGPALPKIASRKTPKRSLTFALSCPNVSSCPRERELSEHRSTQTLDSNFASATHAREKLIISWRGLLIFLILWFVAIVGP